MIKIECDISKDKISASFTGDVFKVSNELVTVLIALGDFVKRQNKEEISNLWRIALESMLPSGTMDTKKFNAKMSELIVEKAMKEKTTGKIK